MTVAQAGDGLLPYLKNDGEVKGREVARIARYH
jgi:hypothetical protein